MNTNGDFGSCSRWSRLRERNSSPRIGACWGCLVDPADVQGGRSEVDLIPSQVRQVPVGYNDACFIVKEWVRVRVYVCSLCVAPRFEPRLAPFA